MKLKKIVIICSSIIACQYVLAAEFEKEIEINAGINSENNIEASIKSEFSDGYSLKATGYIEKNREKSESSGRGGHGGGHGRDSGRGHDSGRGGRGNKSKRKGNIGSRDNPNKDVSAWWRLEGETPAGTLYLGAIKKKGVARKFFDDNDGTKIEPDKYKNDYTSVAWVGKLGDSGFSYGLSAKDIEDDVAEWSIGAGYEKGVWEVGAIYDYKEENDKDDKKLIGLSGSYSQKFTLFKNTYKSSYAYNLGSEAWSSGISIESDWTTSDKSKNSHSNKSRDDEDDRDDKDNNDDKRDRGGHGRGRGRGGHGRGRDSDGKGWKFGAHYAYNDAGNGKPFKSNNAYGLFANWSNGTVSVKNKWKHTTKDTDEFRIEGKYEKDNLKLSSRIKYDTKDEKTEIKADIKYHINSVAPEGMTVFTGYKHKTDTPEKTGGYAGVSFGLAKDVELGMAYAELEEMGPYDSYEGYSLFFKAKF